MNGHREPKGRARRGERGFTLVEILIAMVILTIALLGVAGAVALQSGGIALSLPIGQAAVTRGHYISTATMLAQERLEQIKRLQYTIGPPAVDQISPDPTPTGFADEDFGTITGYPNFRREVRVQTGVPATNIKTVTVTVRFNLPKETGTSEESVKISTLIAARP